MEGTKESFILDRMVRAVEKVRDRMLRCASALQGAGVPYAIVGGNAVAAWVARVDEAAVRNTQDVDLLLRRADIAAATTALEDAGFVYRHAAGVTMFLDGPDAKARDAVHVVFAGEKVRESHSLAAPDVDEAEPTADGRFYCLGLQPLLRMKLTSFRDKDRMHLRDLIGVGLVDESSLDLLPTDLSERLSLILDDPDG